LLDRNHAEDVARSGAVPTHRVVDPVRREATTPG
jgi:hypothetical protein